MIDLYSVPTANGQKVHVMLEECGLPYTPHLLNLKAGEHRQPEFTKLNPFSRVPIIVDHDAGDVTVAETAAILIYLAEKTGKFLPKDAAGRARALHWVVGLAANFGALFRAIFVLGNIVPGNHTEAIAYFKDEARKAFAMMDRELADRPYLAGDAYTIADICGYPFAVTSASLQLDGLGAYPNIRRWAETIGKRAAVQRGMNLFK